MVRKRWRSSSCRSRARNAPFWMRISPGVRRFSFFLPFDASPKILLPPPLLASAPLLPAPAAPPSAPAPAPPPAAAASADSLASAAAASAFSAFFFLSLTAGRWEGREGGARVCGGKGRVSGAKVHRGRWGMEGDRTHRETFLLKMSTQLSRASQCCCRDEHPSGGTEGRPCGSGPADRRYGAHSDGVREPALVAGIIHAAHTQDHQGPDHRAVEHRWHPGTAGGQPRQPRGCRAGGACPLSPAAVSRPPFAVPCRR